MEAITRREALKRSGVVLGGAVSMPLWIGCGAAEPDETAERSDGLDLSGSGQRPAIGVQLYTVRDRMQRDVANTLESVAAIGYTEVETAGYFGIAPERFRSLLDAAGLAAPSGHVGIQALREDLDAALVHAGAIGHHWLVVPWLDQSERTPDGYRRVAAELNRYGAAARERGLRIAYHNHEFEFERLESGETGFEILVTETDPALVDIELDLYWAVKGRRDPVALFERYPGRFALCHVKDMADIGGAERQTEVGRGEIDFARIFAHAELAGLRHYFVELDNPEDSLASIRTSYRHMLQLWSS